MGTSDEANGHWCVLEPQDQLQLVSADSYFFLWLRTVPKNCFSFIVTHYAFLQPQNILILSYFSLGLTSSSKETAFNYSICIMFTIIFILQ